MLILDDFVMLGKTVPEPNSDGRVFVCSAGISPTLRSMVRIYPLARGGSPARWSVNTVKLERNPGDQRRESFRLAGDRTIGAHDYINAASFRTSGSCPPRERAELLRRYSVESIAEANARKLSLAVIHPRAMELEFEHNPTSPDSPELTLFDLATDQPQGARRFPYLPHLVFDDADGTHRRPQLRDWGVYELMRKHNNLTGMTDSDRRSYVGEALHLDNSCSLLIGNFNRHYTSWLVISVLRGLRAARSLLDELEAA